MRRLAFALALLVSGGAWAGETTPNHGTVAEAIVTGEYMYIRVNTAKGEEWLAASSQPLAAGTRIAWSDGQPMPNFFSKRLNRSFDTITLVDVVVPTR